MAAPQDDPRYRFRGLGMSGTATKTTTTNIDKKITEARVIDGAQLILDGHELGDSIKFQVVDVDGVYYPAGTVLEEFGTDWYVAPDQNNQGHLRLYIAKLLANLYIRLVYTSTGTTNDVSVYCNLFLHTETS